MKWNNGIFTGMILLILFACKENKKRTEAEKIVAEWTGKAIQFPEDAQCNILGKDTVCGFCSGLFQKEYKILLYVDSTGCSDCRLKLLQWKQLIEESDSLFQDKLSFLFFFQPKNKKGIEFLFQRDNFDYPVLIDMNNTINRLNQFPQPVEYQCFLLDKDNKIVMIGNPALNPKIWELYKQTVSGKAQTDTTPVTTVFIEQSEMEICNLQVKEKPIEPEDETEIMLEITPEETSAFHKTVRVHCNVENGSIPLIIKGMANQ
jgi:hypothetical protein